LTDFWLNVRPDILESQLPEAGGILYFTDMSIFFAVYHRLPHAPFKYSTGFEPGIMPPEDLKVLRSLQATGALETARPWIDKMTPKDRIFILGQKRPEWPGMEFSPMGPGWMGKKS